MVLIFGDGGTVKYLGSGEDDGFVNIDLGAVKTDFDISCLDSTMETLSGTGLECDAEVTVPDELLIAVLGSLPDTVTVVTTPAMQEVG